MHRTPGPRDWAPPDESFTTTGSRYLTGERPLRGGGHADGFGWAVLFTVTSLLTGIGALVIAANVSLVVDPARTVWIAGLGAVAVWAGAMGLARVRRGRRGSALLARFGIALGIGTIALMGYALVAIMLVPSGTALPVMAQWMDGSRNLGAVDSAQAPPATGSEAPLDPLEAERLELSQSIGTASYVLQQTVSPDGIWPATLLVTTDATALISPDGVALALVPAGTQVVYSTSSDQLQYSLTLIGPSGVAVSYDSATGTIESALP